MESVSSTSNPLATTDFVNGSISGGANHASRNQSFMERGDALACRCIAFIKRWLTHPPPASSSAAPTADPRLSNELVTRIFEHVADAQGVGAVAQLRLVSHQFDDMGQYVLFQSDQPRHATVQKDAAAALALHREDAAFKAMLAAIQADAARTGVLTLRFLELEDRTVADLLGMMGDISTRKFHLEARGLEDGKYGAYTDQLARAIDAFADKNPNLKSVTADLGSNALGDDDDQGLLRDALMKLGKVTDLGLFHNALDGDALSTWLPLIEASSATLSQLDLGSNSFGGTNAVAALARVFALLERLQVLDLENVGLTPDDVAVLAPTLRHMRLRDLDLGRNNLTGRGLQALREGALQHRELEGLSRLALRANGLQADDAPELASTLQPLSNLAELDLGYNALGDTGVPTLVATLLDLTHLDTLKLNENQIRDATPLVPLLDGSIRCLNLSSNRMGSVQALSEAPGLTQLEDLDLSYCWIIDPVPLVQVFIDKIESGEPLNLRRLALSGNNLSDAGHQALERLDALIRARGITLELTFDRRDTA